MLGIILFWSLLGTVQGQMCYRNRYPLTIGTDGKDTVFTHFVQINYDWFIVGGYSTQLRNQQDAFMAMTYAPSLSYPRLEDSKKQYFYWNGKSFIIEQIAFDQNLNKIIAIFSLESEVYLGSIGNHVGLPLEKIRRIDQNVDTAFQNNFKTQYEIGNFGPFLIKSLSEIYMAINLIDGKKFGFLKFTNIDGGSSFHKVVQCSNTPGAKCFTDVIALGNSQSILNVGSVLDNGVTLTSLTLFASDGTWLWDYVIKQSDTVDTEYYKTKAISYQGDRFISIMENSDSIPSNIRIVHFMQSGLQSISGHQMYEIGDGTVVHKVLNVDFRDSSNILIGVKDLTNSVDKLMMIGKQTQQFQQLILQFPVNQIVWKNPSNDFLDAIIIGEATQLSDGSLTHTFQSSHGFIMPLVINEFEYSCFTLSHSWGLAETYSTGTISSSNRPPCMEVITTITNPDSTVTQQVDTAWSDGPILTLTNPEQEVVTYSDEVKLINGTNVTVTIATYHKQWQFTYTNSTTWTWKQSFNQIISSWNHGVGAELSYEVSDVEQLHQIQNFSMLYECTDIIKNYSLTTQNTNSSGQIVTFNNDFTSIQFQNYEPYLKVYTFHNKDYYTETSQISNVYPGGKHTITVKGFIQSQQQQVFPGMLNEIYFSVKLAIKKECNKAIPLPIGIANDTHYPQDLTVAQYDHLATPICERQSQAFQSNDTGCSILYEMSYLDISNQKVVFPSSEDSSYLLYHSDPTSNMFHIFYNKPIVNSDSANYTFQVRAYIDLSDSVSSNITPNEYVQTEQFNVKHNCSIESLTPSVLNSQYSYIFHDSALVIQVPVFTTAYPACQISYLIEKQNTDLSWTTDDYPANPTTFEKMRFLANLATYQNSTRQIKFFSTNNNYYSKSNDLNRYTFRVKGILEGGAIAYSNQFDVDIVKDCQYATLTQQAISHQNIVYIAGESKQIVSFTIPKNSDPYCTLDHLIEVQRDSTGAWQDYQTVFGNNIITNVTYPSAAGQHEIEIQSLTNDYMRLNDYVGKHKVRFTAKIGNSELIQGGSRASVSEEFTLEIKSFCHSLKILPSNIQDLEFEVYENTKSYSLPPFKLKWPWVSPSIPLDSTSAVTEAQVRAICGDWVYTAYEEQTMQPIDSDMNLKYTQTSIDLSFKSKNVYKSVTNSAIQHEKRHTILLKAELSSSPYISNNQTFGAWIRFHCWRKEILNIKNSESASGLFDMFEYPKETYIVNNNNISISKDMGIFTWNQSCAQELVPTIELEVIEKNNKTLSIDHLIFNNVTARKIEIGPISQNIYSQKLIIRYKVNLMRIRDAQYLDDLHKLNPGFTQVWGFFFLDVLNCQISQIIAPQLPDFTYQIKESGQKQILGHDYQIFRKCFYKKYYESFVISENEKGERIYEELPEYIQFVNQSDWKLEWHFQTNDLSLNNTHMKILTRLTIVDEESNNFVKNTTDESLIWRLYFVNLPFYPDNKPPYIEPGVIPLGLQRIKVNETYQLHIDGSKISSDTISLVVHSDQDKIYEFASSQVDPLTFSTTISIAPKSTNHLGIWRFQIFLTDKRREDEKGQESLQSLYFLSFEVYQEIKNYGKQKEVEVIEEKKEYIIPKIQSIGDFGLLEIGFSEILREKILLKKQSNQQFYQIVQIEVLPGKGQDGKNINFKYKIQDFNPYKLQIQLEFDKAIYISTGESPDILNVTFIDVDWFQKTDNQMITVEPFKSIQRIIPSQLQNDDASKRLASVAGAASTSQNAVVLTQLSINIVLSASMAPLWGMINALQVVMNLQGVQIKFPSNTKLVFKQTRKVTEAQIFPQEYIEILYFWKYFAQNSTNNQTKRLLQDIEQQTSLQEVGFESEDVIENLQSQYVFIIILLSIVILILPTLYIFNKRSKAIGRLYQKIRDGLFWSGITRAILEYYLELCLIVFINLKLKSTNNSQTNIQQDLPSAQLIISSILEKIFIFVIFSTPIISLLFMMRNQINLQNLKEFEPKTFSKWNQKYGSFFEGLHLWRDSCLYYSSFFMLRRMLMAIVLVYLSDFSAIQFILIMQLNVFAMIIIGLGRPHETVRQNSIEVINEFLTCIATYHLVPFSDMVGNVETKYQMGYSMIYTVGSIMLFNLLNIIKIALHQACAGYRKFKMKRRYDKELKRIKQIQKNNQQVKPPLYVQQLQQNQAIQNYNDKYHNAYIKMHIKPGMTNQEIQKVNEQALEKIQQRAPFICEAKGPNRFAVKLHAQLEREKALSEFRRELQIHKNIEAKTKKSNILSNEPGIQQKVADEGTIFSDKARLSKVNAQTPRFKNGANQNSQLQQPDDESADNNNVYKPPYVRQMERQKHLNTLAQQNLSLIFKQKAVESANRQSFGITKTLK